MDQAETPGSQPATWHEYADTFGTGAGQLDYAHIWHLDSYDTQFTNGTLTIAVNGLSLEKYWCDNMGGLLQAAEEVRASPTNFSMMDCFPPNTNRAEIDKEGNQLATQFLKAINKGKYSKGEMFASMGVREEGPSIKKVDT
ncbi:hypothetical protein FF1_032429 [Malus domestica]